jgi:hypothetical protein
MTLFSIEELASHTINRYTVSLFYSIFNDRGRKSQEL